MPSAETPTTAPSIGRLARLLGVLWLAGVAMRMTILAMPPVIPQVHDELRMSETQVGLLIGLPLLMFALAAIPGSLLIARTGARLAVVVGMIVAAVAGGARAAAIDIPTLYAAAIATGIGVAIMQPGMPTLVREWLPSRIALGTLAYTSGMLMGAFFPPALTTPVMLPLGGGSWRVDLVAWAIPALLIAPVFLLLSPKGSERSTVQKLQAWWPDFKNPAVWLLGLTLGSNNSPYFAVSAFVGDYLRSKGNADLLGTALSWLNGSQLIALIILISASGRLQQRAWPFLIFGPLLLAGFLLLMIASSSFLLIAACTLIGFAVAITFTPIMAMVPIVSSAQDLPRTAAGMLTIGYTCAIVIPTICGALWDITGQPWAAFLPLCVCAVTLTVLGALLTRRSANKTLAAA
ncbi:MAG TPA: MFS transporter [Xanthobacteraceae bacterium]|nr:MFS transporter [Xanthobacteraceae bacterium]